MLYDFSCVPTVKAFYLSRKRIKGIMGPFGSGKSSGCVISLVTYSMEQAPGADGVRRTRYAIVRNSVKELKDTTKATIDTWVADLGAVWRESEDKYLFRYRLQDGTVVESEWLLRSLDRPEQIKDLLSLDLTGAWINEAREIPREIFDAMDGRIGRYPPRQVAECSYPVILMDTNPPDTDNWFYKYFEEEPLVYPELREKAELFKQPSGLSPHAENLKNLPKDYYKNLVIGKDKDFIRVYVHGEYGYVREGKPVFPNFAYSVHVAKEPLKPVKSGYLIVGMDFGLFPAAVVVQQLPDGRLHVYDELVSTDAMDLEEFVRSMLLPLLSSPTYIRLPFYVVGDPAGRSRSQLDSRTCFMALKSMGIKAMPAYTNAYQPRIQAVNQYLTRFVKGGQPAFQINPNCTTLIKGLNGKYCFKRLRLTGDRYSDIPIKNEYSHVCDALMYACVGYAPQQRMVEDVFETTQHATTYTLSSI